MNRAVLILGTVLIIADLLWPWVKMMHLFHLPGDILVDRPGFKFMFPITTMLIVSAVLSLLGWLMRRSPARRNSERRIGPKLCTSRTTKGNSRIEHS
jgi:membrane protein implicated in regulation of membrane protease activity